MAAKLTPKQQRFVREYLTCLNATKAAKAAGYSEKTAHSAGPRLLANVGVAAEIAKRQEKRADRLEITADRVLQELAMLAFFDPRSLFREDGSPKAIGELDEHTAKAIAGLDVNELWEGSGDERAQVGVVKKFRLADKGQNLERLGKHLRLFTEVLHVTNDPILTKPREELDYYAKTGYWPTEDEVRYYQAHNRWPQQTVDA